MASHSAWKNDRSHGKCHVQASWNSTSGHRVHARCTTREAAICYPVASSTTLTGLVTGGLSRCSFCSNLSMTIRLLLTPRTSECWSIHLQMNSQHVSLQLGDKWDQQISQSFLERSYQEAGTNIYNSTVNRVPYEINDTIASLRCMPSHGVWAFDYVGAVDLAHFAVC